MELITIEVQFREDETHTSQILTLDGVRIRLDTYTNKADGGWYLDVFDEEDTPLVTGIGIVTGLDIFFPYRYLPIPPGILFINDLVGEQTDPVLDTFVNRDAELIYETVA